MSKRKPITEQYDLKALPTDVDGLVDMLAAVQADIDDITCQLAEIDADNDDWERRAVSARKYLFGVRAKLNIALRRAETASGLRGDRSMRISKQMAKNENLRLQKQIAEEAAARKAERIAASNSVERRRLSAVLDWLREHHPAIVDDLFAVMRAIGQEGAQG